MRYEIHGGTVLDAASKELTALYTLFVFKLSGGGHEADAVLAPLAALRPLARSDLRPPDLVGAPRVLLQDVVAVMGPPGCGKSTGLQTISIKFNKGP